VQQGPDKIFEGRLLAIHGIGGTKTSMSVGQDADLEPMDGREGPSTSGKNPGGIFERVPEKICLAPCSKLPS